MCGISGFVMRKGAAVDRALFRTMTDVVSYRGPDDEGFFFEENLALGHRRLAIIDLSPEGHQPMLYAGRYTVVYNGEIYNYIELRQELERAGYAFDTQGDTEVLLAAYAHWGRDCTRRFNGMWAFAIYDAQERTLFCSRDRFAIKPFYYYLDEDRFAFASEIKQLLPLKPEGFEMDTDRAWAFLCRGLLEYGEGTFFRGIRQLPGGFEGLYSLKDNTWETRQWYDLSQVAEKENGFENAAKDFYERFNESVRLRLRADVPVGSCLSGGLDSSAIVCAAAEILKETPGAPAQHTVSSVYDEAAEQAYDEQEYMDAVVAHTGVTSHKVRLRPEKLFEQLDKQIWHNDEPLASTSPCAQWVVFEEAKRQGLTVMLDGQGSDEQLAGYSGFFAPIFSEMLKRRRYRELFRAVKWFNQNRAQAEGTRAELYLLSAIWAMPDESKGPVTKLISGWAHRRLAKNPVQSTAENEVPYPFEMNREGLPTFYNNGNFRQFTLDMITVNIRSLLHYEDRNSMAHSIESRVPFLDYRLAEAMFAMPYNYKQREGVTKAVMREGLRGQLTEKVRTRVSKLGFATPEDVWLRQHPQWFRQQLQTACTALGGLLDEEKVLAWFDGCQKTDKKDFISFRIICLGRWAKLFNVQVK